MPLSKTNKPKDPQVAKQIFTDITHAYIKKKKIYISDSFSPSLPISFLVQISFVSNSSLFPIRLLRLYLPAALFSTFFNPAPIRLKKKEKNGLKNSLLRKKRKKKMHFRKILMWMFVLYTVSRGHYNLQNPSYSSCRYYLVCYQG